MKNIENADRADVGHRIADVMRAALALVWKIGADSF